jgi:hypothetical protein
MRKTILFGALAALIGLGAVAKANDQAANPARDTIEMTAQGTQVAANDRDGGKADRAARNNHEYVRKHDAKAEKHGEARGEDYDFDGDEGLAHKRH